MDLANLHNVRSSSSSRFLHGFPLFLHGFCNRDTNVKDLIWHTHVSSDIGAMGSRLAGSLLDLGMLVTCHNFFSLKYRLDAALALLDLNLLSKLYYEQHFFLNNEQHIGHQNYETTS
jgi:hypothetical protein